MSKYQLNVLLVDEREQDFTTINELLTDIKSWQCTLDYAPTYEVALKKIEAQRPDICLFNPHLEERAGFNPLQQLFKNEMSTSLVLLGKPGTPDLPGETMDAEAVDYLVKGAFDADHLKRSIHFALRYKQLEGSLEKRVQERAAEILQENRQLKTDLNQRRVEEASRIESEQRYRSLFDVDIYGVEVLDEKGEILDCNTTYQKMLGYELDDLIGFHSTAFVSDKSKASLNKKLSMVQKRGYAEGELEMVCKDGSSLMVWRRMRALRHTNGDFAGTVAYNRDITERMKAVRQISTLARALEQSPVALLITDGEGTIEYMNFRFTELTGYTYEETVGQSLRFVKSFEEDPEAFKELWETIGAGEEWEGQFYNLTKEGEGYWELLTITPMFSPQGTITHFIAAQEDITGHHTTEDEAFHTQQRVGDLMSEHINDLTATNEQLQREIADRERIEQDLRRSRSRLKAQYKGIPVPTYSWQMSGKKLILVDYNDVAEVESEGRIADFLGKTVDEIFKENPQVLEDFAQCVENQATIQREAPYQLITTGEIRYFVTTYNFVPPNLVVVHIQDVTEQKRAEEKLQEYKTQAEQAVQHQEALTQAKAILSKEISKRKALEQEFEALRQHNEKSPNGQVAELDEIKAALEQEILKREQMEKALQESEGRFQQIAGNIDERLREQYRSIPIPTYSWQRIAGEFILVDFNDAAAESMGKIVDFFGKSASEIFKDRPDVLADFEKCFQDKTKIVREAPYKMITTGETRYFVTTYNFVPPNLVIDHIQDVTEQKQMEAELEELRHRQKNGRMHTGELVQLPPEMQGEVRKREAAEKAVEDMEKKLKLYHDELEDVVKERTMELLDANKQLQREVFDHQRAEESLKEARARLKAQYKGIPIPTYSWRKVGDDFILIDYNYAAEQNSNGKIAQFISKPAREIFSDRPQVLADFSRCYNERKSVRRESPYRLVTSGETKHYITTYNFAPPNVMIVYIQDVTELKVLEDKLSESIGYLELQCRFSAQKQLSFVNEAYCWCFGVKQEEVMGQTLPFATDSDQRKFEQHLAKLSRKEPTGTIDCQLKMADGTISRQRWVSRVTFDEDGRLKAYHSTGKEIPHPEKKSTR